MNNKKSHGITLNEILFGLLTVVILAVVVLPVVAQSDEDAHRLTCLQNANQIGKAQIFYANDNDEQFVLPFEYQAPFKHDDGSFYRDYTSWPAILSPYVKNLRVYVCPDQWNLPFVTSEK